MLAVVVNEVNKLSSIEVREISPPEPESNQVLIESVAAGLNFPDLLQIRGKYQIVQRRRLFQEKKLQVWSSRLEQMSNIFNRVIGYW